MKDWRRGKKRRRGGGGGRRRDSILAVLCGLCASMSHWVCRAFVVFCLLVRLLELKQFVAVSRNGALVWR